MNRDEVIWASGIFEGEGCFYQNIIKKGTKTYVYPAASVRMTDMDTIIRFAERRRKTAANILADVAE